jgi:hypothetical protein
VREQQDCAAGWAKGAQLRCWPGSCTTIALLVGREGRSYTITALLSGSEGRWYTIIAQLAGTEGDSATALLAGREV